MHDFIAGDVILDTAQALFVVPGIFFKLAKPAVGISLMCFCSVLRVSISKRIRSIVCLSLWAMSLDWGFVVIIWLEKHELGMFGSNYMSLAKCMALKWYGGSHTSRYSLP